MGIYMALIYRNYQKDLKKMYQWDFSFLPKNVSNNHNKNCVVSILFCRLHVFVATLFIRVVAVAFTFVKALPDFDYVNSTMGVL
jgi:hypothetical protein